MYWGGGLFLFLCIFCFLPMRLQFLLEHNSTWRGTVTVHFLWVSRTVHYPEETEKMQEQSISPQNDSQQTKQRAERHTAAEKGETAKCRISDTFHHEKSTWKRQWKKSWSDWWQRTSFQIHWRALIDFCTKGIRIISRRLQLEELSLQCDIGFSRPDWTAYSYGLFWTILSALPQTWLEHGTFTYTPDFQRPRQEIVLQGIICCRVGQLILMIVSLFWLTITAMLEQKRKEQMLYES